MFSWKGIHLGSLLSFITLGYIPFTWVISLTVSGTSLLSPINLGFLSFTWVIYLSLQNLGYLPFTWVIYSIYLIKILVIFPLPGLSLCGTWRCQWPRGWCWRRGGRWWSDGPAWPAAGPAWCTPASPSHWSPFLERDQSINLNNKSINCDNQSINCDNQSISLDNQSINLDN